MKMFVAIVFSLSAFSALAQEDFSTFKQEHIDHIDREIKMMNKSRSCMNTASNRKALDACKHEMKAQKEEVKKNIETND